MAAATTPPPSSRQRRCRPRDDRLDGQTPTRVGKTWTAAWPCTRCMTDPHACGEDLVPALQHSNELDRPPRVWGRLLAMHLLVVHRGQTPTRVGKTRAVIAAGVLRWGDPHLRGQRSSRRRHLDRLPPHVYGDVHDGIDVTVTPLDRPPRVGGLQPARGGDHRGGQTPTYVGRARPSRKRNPARREDPHVRGECPCSREASEAHVDDLTHPLKLIR